MKKILCLLFISLVIISGCIGNTPTSSAKGSITLVITPTGLSAKTIQPDLDMTIAVYDIYGAGPDGTNFRKNGQTGSTVLLEALAVGLWTITVDAKNDDGIIIASGCTNVTVVAGITTNVGVTVTPLTGTGALKVNLAWPGGAITNPIINATLTPKGDAASNISFTLAGDSLSALYENTALEAGYYTLLVYLYDGTIFKWGAAEAVRIIKGQTSEGNYPIIPGGGEIGDINLIITPDLQNPIDITFSGGTDNLNIGSSITVTAATSETVDTYQWYLNGKPLSGETGDMIAIGSALPKGSYRLDLLVTKNRIVSSESLIFTVEAVNKVISIAAPPCGDNSMFLKEDGRVFVCGVNYFGLSELGGSITTPAQLSNLTDITDMAAGGQHSLFITGSGMVWAQGFNDYGQLGNGITSSCGGLFLVKNLTDAISVAGGYNHSLALKRDGTVWAWGNNSNGQLGNGATTDSNLPVQVYNLTNVTAIAAGVCHNLALTNDGMVWAWGSNNYGQLGNGTTINNTVPVQVQGLPISHRVTAIACGSYHNLALTDNGKIWAWGSNYLCQLGDGTTTNRYYPVPVELSNDVTVTMIAGGWYHSLAANGDKVWAWGQNYNGQLGDATNTSSNIPVQVRLPGGITVAAIAGGQSHSLALFSDGSVWAWGNNGIGELGDGTNVSRNIPGQVIGI